MSSTISAFYGSSQCLSTKESRSVKDLSSGPPQMGPSKTTWSRQRIQANETRARAPKTWIWVRDLIPAASQEAQGPVGSTLVSSFRNYV